MPHAPRQSADFLIEHATCVATCAGPAPRRGEQQGDVSPLQDAVVAAQAGTIVYVGPASQLDRDVEVVRGATRIDARGCTVVPGFVDPHTHVVYAGDRREELRRRLAGATYAQIAAEGGGILSTVAATRSTSDEDLAAATRARLDDMLACGTTTCEAKSGYGLTTESELRMLRVIRALDHEHAIDLVPTFMGAHDVPIEFRHDPEAYVSLVVNEMIPAVVDEGLADWCDVFCETGVFTPEQAVTVLEAGARAGLMPRIHAEELGESGGCSVAVRVGARAADHLLFATERDADALAAANVSAVLLPASAFYLKARRFAPARMLIDRHVPVALGSDVNPGGGHSPSMAFAIALACFSMDMTLEEALVAATLNAAWSLDRAHAVGSLEPGKLMDAVIIGGTVADLVRVGAPAVRMVIKRGKVVAWAH
jgi:imidazolonepropionase